jgi:hydrophobic/amphiphilic exporter-1 (mainly G- bacteria), HAE1 family
MSLARFSVQRPIFTVMVALALVTLGAVALHQLRIDMLPEVEMPRLSVSTRYEGADPEVMERLVTQPVEEIIATVPGVEEIVSASSEGVSRLTVTFSWGTNIDAAAQDVRARLEDELNELPEDVSRPQIRTFDINSFPVVILGVGSTLDPVELTELVQKQIRYRFARVPGVAQVDLWGEFAREVRIEIDPHRLRALGLPLATVLQRVREANVDLPAGEIEDGRYELRLRAPAEYRNVEEIRQTVIAVDDGAPVRIGQIATVEDTYTRLRRLSRINGALGLRLGIRKQASANTVEVSARILEEVERVNRDFRQVQVVVVSNQGNFIERSIANVANSVLYGGALAVLVLLFFLRSARSTLVISVAIPISIVATFALVYFAGLTLNLMTLGGLALGVGMMVDGSIVVLENIFRRRTEGGDAVGEAAVEGTREVAAAIVASTVTTLIVFLPLMFVEGVSGLLFRELAYVVVFSLVCALLVSLSLVPMLASRLLRDTDRTPRSGGRLAKIADRASQALRRLEDGYAHVLLAALRHRGRTLLAAVAATALSLLLAPLIGSEFLPPSDESEVRVTGEMEVGLRLDLVDRQTRLMEAVVRKEVPEMTGYVASVGSSGWRPGTDAQGELQIALVPPTERDRSNEQVAADLRKRLDGKVAGMKIRTRATQGQFVLERLLGTAESGLLIEIRGFDLDQLDELTDRVMEAVEDIDGVTDVEKSRKAGVPEAIFRIDRDKAASHGISVQQIAQTLEAAVAGRQAGEFRPAGDAYRIFVQLQDAHRLELDEILDLTVSAPGGAVVALRSLVQVERQQGPIVIDRKDQQRLITVSANVSGRDIGSVAADVERKLAKIPRPVGYEIYLGGTMEEQREAFGSLLVSLILALMLVYMVLACQYESLRDPLVVMLSVPVAATGVLLTLWLTDTTLNVQSYIGCIMLGGIVVNNAILLVDQAGQLRGRGMAVQAAVREAGRRRLRPILMTTSTTVLGLLPLALGVGEGADAQAPLARAVIGGLVASTVITLVLIPVVYSLFYRERAND